MKNEEFATAVGGFERKKMEWTWRALLCAAFFILHSSLFISCSEDSSEPGEYDNWKQRNEDVLSQWAANSSYRKIISYTKFTNYSTIQNKDYIYVEVLEEGDGTECPIYTDTCRVAYRGRFIPSKTYDEGYVFDQTYIGDFDWQTASATDFVGSGVVDGFCTALMNMHRGDRWRVYIPYQQGYGTTSTSAVPGYSNLIFEMALYDFWHPGETRPAFKSR